MKFATTLAALELLVEQDRERVRLLAGRAARAPRRGAASSGSALLHERTDDLRLQRRPRVGIAEEHRHRDQQVVEQRLRLGRRSRAGAQVVARSSADAPAACAATAGAGPCCACISRSRGRCASAAMSSTLSSALSSSAGDGSAVPASRTTGCMRCLMRASSASRMASSRTGRTRSATPVAIAARGMPPCAASCGILHQDQPAALPSPPSRRRAPSLPLPDSTTAKPSPCVGRERAKEQVDGGSLAARLVERGRADRRIGDHQLAIGRDDVDVVRLRASTVS